MLGSSLVDGGGLPYELILVVTLESSGHVIVTPHATLGTKGHFGDRAALLNGRSHLRHVARAVNLPVRRGTSCDTRSTPRQVRYFKIVLVDDVVDAVTSVVAHVLSSRVLQIANRLNVEILLGIVGFISSTLRVVAADVRYNRYDFLLLNL